MRENTERDTERDTEIKNIRKGRFVFSNNEDGKRKSERMLDQAINAGLMTIKNVYPNTIIIVIW